MADQEIKKEENEIENTDSETQEAKTEEVKDEVKEDVVVEEKVEADVVETIPTVNTKELPDFRVGDTIRIFYKIIEGDKLRTQPYEGIVISKRGSDSSKSFTVRRIGADGVGIERIFPIESPNIDSIKIMKHGKVRRAKLYYLRAKKGREAMRIKEIKPKDEKKAK